MSFDEIVLDILSWVTTPKCMTSPQEQSEKDQNCKFPQAYSSHVTVLISEQFLESWLDHFPCTKLAKREVKTNKEAIKQKLKIQFPHCAVRCIFESGCIWSCLLPSSVRLSEVWRIKCFLLFGRSIVLKYWGSGAQVCLKRWYSSTSQVLAKVLQSSQWCKYWRSSAPQVPTIGNRCSPWKILRDEDYQSVDNKREDEDYQCTIRENNSPTFHAPLEPPSVAGWVDLINWRKRKSK